MRAPATASPARTSTCTRRRNACRSCRARATSRSRWMSATTRRWQRCTRSSSATGAAWTCWSTTPASPAAAAMVETTMAEWRRILEVDLLSVVRGCRLFLPGMLARGRGQVISTASFAGLAGAPGLMSLRRRQGGGGGAVRTTARRDRAEGRTVSVLCPAFFRTNLLRERHRQPGYDEDGAAADGKVARHRGLGRRPGLRAGRGRATS